MGTLEWQTLLGQCCVVPEGILRKKRERRPKASNDVHTPNSEQSSPNLMADNFKEPGVPVIDGPTNFQIGDLPNEETQNLSDSQSHSLFIVPEPSDHFEQESILSDTDLLRSSHPTEEKPSNSTESENRINAFSIENILGPTVTTSATLWPESESQVQIKSIFIKCDIDDDPDRGNDDPRL